MKRSLLSFGKLVVCIWTIAACENENSKFTKAKLVSDESLLNTSEYFKRCEDELGQMPEIIDCKAGEKVEFDNLQLGSSEAHGDPRCKNPSFGVDQADGCRGNSYLVKQKTST